MATQSLRAQQDLEEVKEHIIAPAEHFRRAVASVERCRNDW